ncbi:reverse transcriptase [Gossypium australe]|uniref:Reverse transcriptase n=1 Tax=Gossypium australe TaxID=47621 RepID=A0A5B6VHD9_9ROSI|nr:reverse transcriptase [Gossypium australe]
MELQATVTRRKINLYKSNFTGNTYLRHVTLCEMIESKLARFWCQKGAGKRGIHWCQWKLLCRSKDKGGLGFRNMAQFNISLLTKQGWRLLNYPNSLVAQVFKAKYFPEYSLLNSRLGNSCSYVWRSIWATKDTLEKELIWKVGTGLKISVTEDAWIPNYGNVRLRSSVGNLQFDKVADLIYGNEREWNRDLIVNTFPEDMTDLIFQIPLSLEPHEDFLAWKGESSGEFSVRSSYKLLQSFDPTAYAVQNIYRDFYRKLWHIDIPTKIKIFIWKISWNYITNRVNMAIRRLANSSMCPRCGGAAETLNHLFGECPVSMEMWRALTNLNVLTITNIEFGEWLTMVLTSLSLTQGRIFSVALWAIWGDRNSCVHEKTSKTGQQIASFMLRYLKELDGVRKETQKTANTKIEWSHPPGQEIKINFDGAFDKRSNFSASGVVVRDSRGRVLISSATIHKGVASAFTAEAVACRQATQIALEMNREVTIIEGDSLSVIKKCKNTTQDKSQIGPFILDIHRMKLKGKSLKFEYISRSANNLAHLIATETLRRKQEIYLISRVPDYAAEQARNEIVREPD